jgi:hypothetical protein
MENKTIVMPMPPKKPELLELKKYNWTDLIAVEN